MRMSSARRVAVGVLVAGVLAGGRGVSVTQAQVFTLDTNQSSLTISGNAAGYTLVEQGPGSLTTKYAGTIQAIVTGTTIEFPGQSLIQALTNGSWQPKPDGSAGNAPADYGGSANAGVATATTALRNIQLDAVSAIVSINNGRFDASSVTFLFPSNAPSAIAYRVTGLINKAGFAALSGYGTNTITSLASLTNVGGQQVLALPIQAKFILSLLSTNDTTINLSGQLVATRPLGIPLVIESFTVQNQTVAFQWQATPGQQFQVQSSGNLQSWQSGPMITTPASGSNQWSGSLIGTQGYFRLVGSGP